MTNVAVHIPFNELKRYLKKEIHIDGVPWILESIEGNSIRVTNQWYTQERVVPASSAMVMKIYPTDEDRLWDPQADLLIA